MEHHHCSGEVKPLVGFPSHSSTGPFLYLFNKLWAPDCALAKVCLGGQVAEGQSKIQSTLKKLLSSLASAHPRLLHLINHAICILILLHLLSLLISPPCLTPSIDAWSSLLASFSSPCTVEVVHRLSDVHCSPYFPVGKCFEQKSICCCQSTCRQ